MALSGVTYDSNRPRWAFYSDSYWGGEYWRTPSSPTLGTQTLWVYEKDLETGRITERPGGLVRSYLVPHEGERPSAFAARHSLAAYINLSAPIVDAYVDSVTRGITRTLGTLSGYVKNLDGQGQTWEQLVREWARCTALYGFCGVLLDAPESNPAPNRAAEEALGIGFRATLVTPPSIAWVLTDPDSGAMLEIAFVEQAYSPGVGGESALTDVRLWVYSQTEWKCFQVRVNLSLGLSGQRAEILKQTPVKSGSHPFGEVPVRFAYFRRQTEQSTPFGVSLVADIADIARQVYNKLSNLDHIHRKTAFPFLAIPTRSAGGQLEPETKIEVGPDRAFGYPSDTGAPLWVQPDPAQTKELRDHCLFLIALAYRIAGIEVGTDGTSGVESGLAIQLKSQGFDRMASTFAQSLETAERAALALAGGVLGSSLDPGSLTTYPTRFVLPDSSEDLARAILLIQTLGTQLGTEGLVLAIRQAATAALNLPDAQVGQLVAQVRAQLAPPAAPPTPAPPAAVPPRVS